MTSIVWLVNNITHYHRIRADAFARQWAGSFTILELSNKDDLSVLKGAACDIARTITLFPGTALSEIPRARIRASLLAALERIGPDVCCLNGWNLPGTAIMLHWSLLRNIPCVLMSDSNEHDGPRIWWKDAVKRCFVTQCDAAFVGGSGSRQYVNLLGMSAESIYDGYDVVDNEHFRLGAEKARASDGAIRGSLGLPRQYFLACARFEQKKNLRRLIEAYAEYVQQTGVCSWSLVIAGDGPSRGELQLLAKAQGVAEKVIFKGFVGYEDLPAIYGLARALIHPSTTEQWGLVVNEAMAAGLPVVVSNRCGCVGDLVTNGLNGFTFNPWSTEEITRVLLYAFQQCEYLPQMGRESAAIIETWGPERFARHLYKAIKSAQESRDRRKRMFSKAVVWAMAHQ
jgi:glycosyltransferase involved in cell wall biosynthesis